MTGVRLLRDDKPTNLFYTNEPMTVEVEYHNISHPDRIVPGIVIKDMNQQALIGINNLDLGIKLGKSGSSGKVTINFEKLPLYGNTTYFIDLYFGDGFGAQEVIENAISFHLETKDVFGNGKVLNPKVNTVFSGPVGMKLE